MLQEIIISGFGGQGALFAGQLIAYAGLAEGRHVTWIPSYGPEMRGGTANCTVIISDEEIGSPLVRRPTAAIVLNPPSFERYEPLVKEDGVLLVSQSTVDVFERGHFKYPAVRRVRQIPLSAMIDHVLVPAVQAGAGERHANRMDPRTHLTNARTAKSGSPGWAPGRLGGRSLATVSSRVSPLLWEEVPTLRLIVNRYSPCSSSNTPAPK